MARECLVGLDIGTTKIAAFVGEVDRNGEVQFIGMGESVARGIRKGVVVDIDEAAACIAEAVQAASTSTGYDINSVVVGVTGDHIASLNSKAAIAIPPSAREITSGDVQKAIEQSQIIVLPPDREIINAVPRSYTVDGQAGVRTPVGMSGARLEVETHIVTGSVTLLQNVAKAVHGAGLAIEASVLEPIASAEAVLGQGDRELGAVLVDIGGGTSDIAIFVDGDVVYTSVVAVGGTHVTKDISIGLRMSLEEAERVKRQYGSTGGEAVRAHDESLGASTLADPAYQNMPRVDLDEIIQARMEELFDLVNPEIHKSGYHSMLPAGIILTGGGSQLAGSAELCRTVTGLPTRMGAARPLKIDSKFQTPRYATGIGLVLFGARYPATGSARARHAGASGGIFAGQLGGLAQALQRFFARIMGAGAS